MRKLATTGLLLFTFALMGLGQAAAQITVTGTVTDGQTRDPLPGVSVAVQGTTTGAVTDIDGEYTVTVPNRNAVLVFSFIGYRTVQETVGDRNTIDVALEEDIALLEDVVVVGYGEQRREAVTGSVATIDADEANQGLVTSPTELIQGRVAGVNVISNSGEPGAGVQIRIRGGTSLSASNEPLYVIDGVPIDNVPSEPGGIGVGGAAPQARNPLNLINPNDIENITILKDAAATAIYGSRAANGVIQITTKRGAAGRVQVDYEGFVSASNVGQTLDVLSGPEYTAFLEGEVAAQRIGWAENDEGVLELQDSDNNGQADVLDALGTADTDWQDEILRTGVSQSHNLALSGGATNTQYRASLSYLDQEGVVISSGLERITGRLNASTTTLNDRLRFNLNLQTSFVENDYIPEEEQGGFEGGLLTNALSYNPTLPVTVATDDGTRFYEGQSRSVRNPVALGEQILDFGKTTRSLGNLQAQLDLLPGLTGQVAVGADRSQGSRRIFWPRANPIGADFSGRAVQRNREVTTSTFQSYLTYRTALARVHNVELLGGYEFNEYDTEEFGAESRGFTSDATTFYNLGEGLNEQKPYSFREKSRLVSFFTRGNYSLGERFYLQGVLRYDGSSRFGSGNKWALFPAISAAWRLSEESFLQGFQALSELRIRAGYGITGNQEIGYYRSLALLGADPGARAVLGGVPVTGYAPRAYANPDLKWEETTQFNIGLDYGFVNGKYNGTLEYYLKDTDDLLLEVEVPQPAVLSTRLENIGSIRNQGVEFSFNALVLDRPERNLTVGIVASANDNEVVSLGGREQIITGTVSGRGQSNVNSLILTPGQAVPTFYGYEFIGFNEDGTEQFADLNGDGALTDEDRTYLGSPDPSWTLGFRSNLNVGRVDFSFFLRGEFGRELFNNTALVYRSKNSATQSQNFIRDALNDPDLISAAPFFSSRWVENASFLRLDNVTLGYRVPLETMSQAVRSARLYVSAQNLFVITPYDGLDPEVNTGSVGLAGRGIDYTTYPRPRTFTVGVNLGF